MSLLRPLSRTAVHTVSFCFIFLAKAQILSCLFCTSSGSLHPSHAVTRLYIGITRSSKAQSNGHGETRLRSLHLRSHFLRRNAPLQPVKPGAKHKQAGTVHCSCTARQWYVLLQLGHVHIFIDMLLDFIRDGCELCSRTFVPHVLCRNWLCWNAQCRDWTV